MAARELQELQALQLSESLRKSARMATQLAICDLEHALSALRLIPVQTVELKREMDHVLGHLQSLGARSLLHHG